MFKKLSISFALVCLMTTPVYAEQAPADPVTKSERTISEDFRTVWAAVVQTLGTEGILISALDRSSGIISTKQHIYASGGPGTNKVLDQYVYLPAVVFANWQKGAVVYNVHLNPIGERSTKVTLTPHFNACEIQTANYVSFCQWHETPSKGTLEQKLLQNIEISAKKIAQAGGPKDYGTSAATMAQADDFITKLERLAKLRQSGVLTEAEFLAQKKKILAGL